MKYNKKIFFLSLAIHISALGSDGDIEQLTFDKLHFNLRKSVLEQWTNNRSSDGCVQLASGAKAYSTDGQTFELTSPGDKDPSVRFDNDSFDYKYGSVSGMPSQVDGLLFLIRQNNTSSLDPWKLNQ